MILSLLQRVSRSKGTKFLLVFVNVGQAVATKRDTFYDNYNAVFIFCYCKLPNETRALNEGTVVFHSQITSCSTQIIWPSIKWTPCLIEQRATPKDKRHCSYIAIIIILSLLSYKN